MTTLEVILKALATIALLALAVGLTIWSEKRFGPPRKRR